MKAKIDKDKTVIMHEIQVIIVANLCIFALICQNAEGLYYKLQIYGAKIVA